MAGCYIDATFYVILTEATTPDPDPLAERRNPVGYVTSFNTRGGAVVPVAGDYTSSLITNLSSVTGSSVTAALNTINTTIYATQTANYVFAGPATGAAASPTFRALVDADIPTALTLGTITASGAGGVTINNSSGDPVAVFGAIGQKAVVINNLGLSADAAFNPVAKIHAEANTNCGVRLDAYSNTAAVQSGIQFYRAGGNLSSPSAVQSGDSMGYVGVFGYGATAFSTQSRASIKFLAAGNWTDTSHPTSITFYTTPSGSTTPGLVSTWNSDLTTSWTGAMSVTAAGGVQVQAAATQDAIRMIGRAGGTGTYIGTLTPTTLTASRTWTFPDATVLVAGSAAAITASRLPMGTATAGVIIDSTIAQGSITGLLTIAKAGTTARTITFPDAAITVAGSAAVLTEGRMVRVAAGGLLADTDILVGAANGVISRTGALTLKTTTATSLVLGTNDASTYTMASGAATVSHTASTIAETGTALFTHAIKGGGGTNQGAAYYINKSTTGTMLAFGDSSAIIGGAADTNAMFYTQAGVPLIWYIGAGERARMTATGQLLVGTTAAVGSETFRNNGATVLGDISIGAADGAISRAGHFYFGTDAEGTTNRIYVKGRKTGDSARAAYMTISALYNDMLAFSGTTYIGYDSIFSLIGALASLPAALDYPIAYRTGATGSGMFSEAGHLVLSPRTSLARDIIFVGGTSPAEIARFDMSAGAFLVGATVGVGSERLRVAGGTASTPGATDCTFGGGSVRGGADAYFNTVRVGLGGGAVSSNTVVGAGAMAATATGGDHTYVGYVAGASITNGSKGTAVGSGASGALTTGSNTASFGYVAALSITTTSGWTIVGSQAGRYQSGGTTALTESTNSVFLGYLTKGTQSASNEIAVGYAAEGKGSNTAVWGNTSITDNYLTKSVTLRTSADAGKMRWHYDSSTGEYGMQMRVLNKTGGASIKGYLLRASSTTNYGFQYVAVDEPDPIYVVYESGVADGSEMWVWAFGLVQIYTGNACSRRYVIRAVATGDADTTSGRATAEAAPSSPFATDKHFQEIAHAAAAGSAGLNMCWMNHAN